MSRLPDTWTEPGPECYCGSELRAVPLPDNDLLRALAGTDQIWVHAVIADRCLIHGR